MGLGRPPKVMKNRFSSATTLSGSATLPFVISTEAQRSGEISVWMLLLGNVFRPTPISCFALLAKTTFAPLREESRMQIIKATGSPQEIRGAQWRDLRLLFPEYSHTLFSPELFLFCPIRLARSQVSRVSPQAILLSSRATISWVVPVSPSRGKIRVVLFT